MKPPWSRVPGQLGLVALAVFAVFSTSLPVPFLSWDDTYYVTLSTRTQTPGWAGFAHLWSLEDVWAGRFLEFFPLRDSVYWVLFQAFGMNPLPFHLVNVALHALASMLVLLLGRKLAFTAPVAFGAALLFAVHPIHVESVTWVASLKDPLASCFVLAGLWCYLEYRARPRPLLYALTLACLVAGLLSKAIALPMPLVMVAIDRLEGEPAPWRKTLLRAVAPLAIGVLFAVQFMLVAKAAHVIAPPHGGSGSAHFLLSGWAFARYLQLAIAPASSLLHYCFEPVHGLTDPRFWGALVAVVGFLVALVVAWRRSPKAALLLTWFLVFLLPVSNVVPILTVLAERYLYLPSVAVCLGLAWACSRLRSPGLVVGALVATYGVTTLMRGVVWQSEQALWSEVVEQGSCAADDGATSALVFLKDAAFQKDPVVVLERFRSALSHPGIEAMLPEDHCGALAAGAAAARQLDPPLARTWAEASARRCPWLVGSWDAVVNATSQTDPQRALEAARQGFRLAPNAVHRWQLGAMRLRAGDAAGAEEVIAAARAARERLCGPTVALAQQLEPALRDSVLTRSGCR